MGQKVQYEYAWAIGSRIAKRFPPKVFGPILMRYLRMYNQRLAAEKLLEEATPVDSRLHEVFQWDDARAGHQHRLSQARHLLRSLDYRFETEGGKMQERATTIIERTKQSGKYFYSALKPAAVLKEAEEDCARTVEKIVSQLEHVTKRCPQILAGCPGLREAIDQMRALKDKKS